LNSEPGTFFSPDYATARDRFTRAARAAGARTEAIALDARGPAREALTIDIAWLGAPDADRVLLHTSGMHGVEAFPGCAVQLAALSEFAALAPGCALVLAHALNPYGMARLRRTNENNVDLNRNFLAPGESYRGSPPLYARIDAVLNPASPPGFDFFRLKALGLVMRYGMGALRQAVAQGQYDYPRGLFYGGSMLEQGPALFLGWLGCKLARVRYLFVLDAHSGLGAWGEQTLIGAPGVNATGALELAGALAHAVIDPADSRSPAYTIRGGMAGALRHTLPAARMDFVLQEIGTCSAIAVLGALREENRWHHYGAATVDHPAKLALREALCPGSPVWRRRVLAHGRGLLERAAVWTWNYGER